MSKTFKITGLKETKRKFAAFERLIRSGSIPAFEKAGVKAIEIIKARTAKSLDRKGKSFRPYSKAYAKRKGTTKVDLDLSTRMLDAIETQAFKKGVRIFIATFPHEGKLNTFNLGVIHVSGAGNMPQRDFFGLSKKEVEQVLNVVRRFYRTKLHEIY